MAESATPADESAVDSVARIRNQANVHWDEIFEQRPEDWPEAVGYTLSRLWAAVEDLARRIDDR